MTRALFSRPLDASPRLVHHLRHHLTRPSIRFPFSTGQPHHYQPESKAHAFSRTSPLGSDLESCSIVTETAQKYKIRLWTDLRGLKGVRIPGNNPCKLNTTASRSHCFDLKSIKYIDKIEHPFTKSALQFYIDKTDIPLWYNGWAASGVSGTTPLPSRKAAKRVTNALREALACYGYDRDGRRVTTDGLGDPKIKDLYGTLSVGCMNAKGVLNTSFVDIVEMAKVIIGRAERELGRDDRGRHVHGSSYRPKPGYDSSYKLKPSGHKSKPNGKPAGLWKQSQPFDNSSSSRTRKFGAN
ncbi:hypothetical protein F4810DRAFT_314854 [Camillea tinctor]|nr:hypothetical protein F4810DRAFT_314854 [Camillea tinctor]